MASTLIFDRVRYSGDLISGHPFGMANDSPATARSINSASTELTAPEQFTSPTSGPPGSALPTFVHGSLCGAPNPAEYRNTFSASIEFTASEQSTFPEPGASHASPARSPSESS